MRFPEEQQVLGKLLEEWYAGIKTFTNECNGIFTEKAKQYDQTSPVWHRIEWPHSFVGELRKKTDRISQLMANFDPQNPANSVSWDDIDEELADIVNYARMMAAINSMVEGRE